MFEFLNYSIHGWTIGAIVMALGLVAYVVILFRISKRGSLRIRSGGSDGLRGSLRITRSNSDGLRGSLRSSQSPKDEKKD